jgi:hypothetical protein
VGEEFIVSHWNGNSADAYVLVIKHYTPATILRACNFHTSTKERTQRLCEIGRYEIQISMHGRKLVVKPLERNTGKTQNTEQKCSKILVKVQKPPGRSETNSARPQTGFDPWPGTWALH